MSAVQTEQSVFVPTGTWNVDAVHSAIRFDVIDVETLAKSVSGRFTDFEGTLEGDEQRLSGVVHTASVNSDNEMRDTHLRAADMLDTTRYPEIRFQSTAVEHVEGDLYKLRGDLTIKEIPVEIELDAKLHGVGTADGTDRVLFRVSGELRVGPDPGRDHSRDHGDPPVMAPVRILGISGSLREGSYNRALLRAAAELAPSNGIELTELDLSPIPFYHGDVEAAGDPDAVVDMRRAVHGADALLLATPEYNRGTSGVLKNALDWLSRPALASVLRWKPVGVIGASSGRGGTRRAQQQVRDALHYPGAHVLEEPEVAVTLAWEHFDADGRLTNEETRAALDSLLGGLANLALTRAGSQAA